MRAIKALATMISREMPDLVIVTGDISFAVPYISGTCNNAYAHRLFGRIMERLGVYYTIALGNHDSESYNYYGRQSVGKMYEDEDLEYCLFKDEGEISGVGNHEIRVKNSKGLVTESFYMIDSHAYTDDDPLGIKWDYDYVKDDQIDWYEARVKRAVTDNAALYVSLPTEQKAEYSELLLPKSLVFMHIPPYEVKVAYDEYVNNGRENTDTVQFVNGSQCQPKLNPF